jgi:phage tail-like protein
MALGGRTDPYHSYNFLVEIDGITRAAFQEVSGLDSETAVTTYREGGDALTARKVSGLTTYADITLRRGITDDAELQRWRKQVVDGVVERRNGSIVLLDDTGEERLRWNFREAWPSKWTGPSLNATENAVAIETLVLAVEGLERA